MLIRLSFFVGVATGVLLMVVPCDAARRGNGSKKQNQPTVSNVAFDGTIEAVGTRGIEVKANGGKKGGGDGKNWLVAAAQDALVSVTGTAEPSYLKTGQIVEFSAVVDADGNVADDITSLSIYNSVVDHSLGVTIDNGHGSKAPKDPGVGGKKDPGVAGSGAASKPAATATADRSPAVELGTSQSLRIIGKITSCTADKFAVHAKSKVIRAKLSPTAAIKVDLTNIALTDSKIILPGSKVNVRGEGAAGVPGGSGYQGKLNECVASSVTITLLHSLKGKTKPTRTDAGNDSVAGNKANKSPAPDDATAADDSSKSSAADTKGSNSTDPDPKP